MSWKISKDLCNIFAGQNRSTLTCAEHREAGNRIGNGPDLKRMLLKWGQDDAAVLDIASSGSPARMPSLRRIGPGRTICPLVETLVCMVRRSYPLNCFYPQTTP